VPRLWRWGFLLLCFPALTGWANFWRAYGARVFKGPPQQRGQDAGLKPGATKGVDGRDAGAPRQTGGGMVRLRSPQAPSAYNEKA